MRKLYLVNEVGTTYFLDYKNNTLIETLDGLGFDFDIEYQDFADKFELIPFSCTLCSL